MRADFALDNAERAADADVAHLLLRQLLLQTCHPLMSPFLCRDDGATPLRMHEMKLSVPVRALARISST